MTISRSDPTDILVGDVLIPDEVAAVIKALDRSKRLLEVRNAAIEEFRADPTVGPERCLGLCAAHQKALYDLDDAIRNGADKAAEMAREAFRNWTLTLRVDA